MIGNSRDYWYSKGLGERWCKFEKIFLLSLNNFILIFDLSIIYLEYYKNENIYFLWEFELFFKINYLLDNKISFI